MGNLTDQMEALVQGIHASTRDRASAVADIKAGTWRMLSAFNGERRASATRLRSELSADCRARAADVRKMRHELGADRRTRVKAVAKLMDDFKTFRSEMAQELTESLGMFAQRVQSQVSSLREGSRASLREIREDVQAAHQVWRNLFPSQAGVAASGAIPGLRGKHEEIRRAKERAAAEAVRQRKAEEEQRTKEARVEKPDDEKKVLDVIRDRPDGISVSRMSEILGLPASLVGRIATELVEQGKVQKNSASRLYFPVRGSRST